MEKLGEAAACAVKRTNLDFRIVQAAKRVGATYHEGFEVGMHVLPWCLHLPTAAGRAEPWRMWGRGRG